MASENQHIFWRIFWFGAGGGLSALLNWGPFEYMRSQGHLSVNVAYAISLVTVTVIFSVWNYFINFRTHRSWRDCLPRYLGALAICALINFVIASTGIKKWGDTRLMSALIIFTVQVSVAGPKFLLYHYWVYPRQAVPAS